MTHQPGFCWGKEDFRMNKLPVEGKSFNDVVMKWYDMHQAMNQEKVSEIARKTNEAHVVRVGMSRLPSNSG